MKTASPILATLLGLVSGTIVFFLLGVPILFSIVGAIFQTSPPRPLDTAIVVVAFFLVLLACLWIAGRPTTEMSGKR